MSVLFQCPECRRLVEVSRARATDASVWLRCGECGAESALERADAEGPDARIALHTDEIARDLGRVDERAEDDPVYARLLALETPDEALPIAKAFVALLERWDDLGAHEKVLKQATAQGQLAALGMRYRAVLDARPGDAQAAMAQQRIVNAALATMTPRDFVASAGESTGTSMRLVILVIIALAIVGGLLAFWVRHVGGLI